jgi:hypothetical protein
MYQMSLSAIEIPQLPLQNNPEIPLNLLPHQAIFMVPTWHKIFGIQEG